jgi:hypothetical protein
VRNTATLVDPKTIEVTTDDLRNLCIVLTRWIKTRNEPGRWSPQFEDRTEKLRARLEGLISAREEQVGFVTKAEGDR